MEGENSRNGESLNNVDNIPNTDSVKDENAFFKAPFKLSFKSKKKDAVIVNTSSNFNIENETTFDESDADRGLKRAIVCLENGVIKDDELIPKKKGKKEYVIKLQRTTDWRIEKLRKLVDEGIATDDEKARLTLMLEASGEIEASTSTLKNGTNILNLSEILNEDAVEDADYNQIPIKEFGIAFLKGCGWKEGMGIGKNASEPVKMRISEPRPKGLGLGAKIASDPTYKDAKGQTKNKIKSNTHVEILSGSERGHYGTVQSMDEDNASCFVELSKRGNVVRVSQYNIKILEEKPTSHTSSSNGNTSSKYEYHSKKTSSLNYTSSKRSPDHTCSSRTSNSSKYTSSTYNYNSSRKSSKQESREPNSSKNDSSSRRHSSSRR